MESELVGCVIYPIVGWRCDTRTHTHTHAHTHTHMHTHTHTHAYTHTHAHTHTQKALCQNLSPALEKDSHANTVWAES